jgi:hypothetical protein
MCLPVDNHDIFGTWFLGKITDGNYCKHTDGRNNT